MGHYVIANLLRKTYKKKMGEWPKIYRWISIGSYGSNIQRIESHPQRQHYSQRYQTRYLRNDLDNILLPNEERLN